MHYFPTLVILGKQQCENKSLSYFHGTRRGMNYSYTQSENWIRNRSLFSSSPVGPRETPLHHPPGNRKMKKYHPLTGGNERRNTVAEAAAAAAAGSLGLADLHNFNEVSFLSSAQSCMKLGNRRARTFALHSGSDVLPGCSPSWF